MVRDKGALSLELLDVRVEGDIADQRGKLLEDIEGRVVACVGLLSDLPRDVQVKDEDGEGEKGTDDDPSDVERKIGLKIRDLDHQ